MQGKIYTIGISFKPNEACAVLTDAFSGETKKSACIPYSGRVSTEGFVHPMDLLDSLQKSVASLLEGGADAEKIGGIGITMASGIPMPVMKDGTPLCFFKEYENAADAVPAFNFKGSAETAARLNEAALAGNEALFSHHPEGFSESSVLTKILDIFERNPELFETCDRFIETSDWITWQLLGYPVCNAFSASVFSVWSKTYGWPEASFFAGVKPGFERICEKMLNFPVVCAGTPCGKISKQAAELLGLPEDVIVTAASDPLQANMAAYRAFNNTLFLQHADRFRAVVSGSGSEDILVPAVKACGRGFLFEDTPAFYLEPDFKAENPAGKIFADPAQIPALAEKAAGLEAGEAGLILTSAVAAGLTGETRPEHLLRAGMEKNLYPLRSLIEAFAAHNVEINTIILNEKSAATFNKKLASEICGTSIYAGSEDLAPLGAAIFAAKACGFYESVQEAGMCMSRHTFEEHVPDPAAVKTYDRLYHEYVKLDSYFSGGANNVLGRLSEIKAGALKDKAGPVDTMPNVVSPDGPGFDEDEYEAEAPTLESEFGIIMSQEDETMNEYSDEVRAAAEAAAKELFEAIDAVASIRNDAELYAAFKDIVEEEAEKHTQEILSAADEVAGILTETEESLWEDNGNVAD